MLKDDCARIRCSIPESDLTDELAILGYARRAAGNLALTDEVVRAHPRPRRRRRNPSQFSTAVQEVAAGIWSRAFAAVKVEPETSQAAQASNAGS